MDSVEYAALFRDSYRILRRFIADRIDDPELALDLTSEVFAVGWSKAKNGTAVNRSWLFTTARNLIGNEYQRRDRERSRSRDLSFEEMADAIAPETSFASMELRHAMRRLRPDEAEVLHLTYWADLKGGDIAKALGISHVAVRIRLSRARAALRILLDDGTAGTAPVPNGGKAIG